MAAAAAPRCTSSIRRARPPPRSSTTPRSSSPSSRRCRSSTSRAPCGTTASPPTCSGLVVEKVSGKRLSDFLKEAVWDKVQMPDTTFTVPADKRSRIARPFANDPLTGKPQQIMGRSLDDSRSSSTAAARARSPRSATTCASARCSLNGGEIDGQRVLSPKTVAFMASDHLGANIKNQVRRHRGASRRLRLRPRASPYAPNPVSRPLPARSATSPGTAPTALRSGSIQRSASSWSTAPPHPARSASTTASRSRRWCTGR